MIRNTIEVEVGGKKIGFRTGMLAISAACTAAGCRTTEELFQRITSIDLIATLALYYGAAYEYADKNKLPKDFTMSDVGDWLDDLGEEKANEIAAKMLESYTPKNSNPPEQPGEVKEQQ